MTTDTVIGISGLVPLALRDPGEASQTLPAIGVGIFVEKALLSQESALFNVSHNHLGSANVGYLWTNHEAIRKGKQILGQAEMPSLWTGSPWAKARQRQQLEEWFPGDPLDFLITLYAPYIAMSPAPNQLALLEHELYHCGQKVDQYECPMFSRDGRPIFELRGHDVEEFVGVTRRYGVGAGRTLELAEALASGPELSLAAIDGICGSCTR